MKSCPPPYVHTWEHRDGRAFVASDARPSRALPAVTWRVGGRLGNPSEALPPNCQAGCRALGRFFANIASKESLRNVALELQEVIVVESTGQAGSVAVPVAPLYLRVIEDITEKIRAGVWPVGFNLPTPRVLAEVYTAAFEENVSPGTVRRATDLLADRGVLIGHQGKAVKVARIPE
jgi:hypothetical protein